MTAENKIALMENVMNRAKATTENQTKSYVGSTGLRFKNRFTKNKQKLQA